MADHGVLTEAEEQLLVDELVDALHDVIDSSGCLDMAPLYWIATLQERREFLRHVDPDDAVPSVSPRLRRLGKSSRTKYACLSVWRHAVLWRRVGERVDPDFRRAMDALYFTPYKENRPPYAWSRKSSEAPGVETFDGPNELDRLAREGCWLTIIALRREVADWNDGSIAGVARKAFVRAGVRRRTLRDQLRLEEQWEDDNG